MTNANTIQHPRTLQYTAGQEYRYESNTKHGVATWKGRIFFFSGSYATASASNTMESTSGLSSPLMRDTMSGYLGVLFSALLRARIGV